MGEGFTRFPKHAAIKAIMMSNAASMKSRNMGTMFSPGLQKVLVREFHKPTGGRVSYGSPRAALDQLLCLARIHVPVLTQYM